MALNYALTNFLNPLASSTIENTCFLDRYMKATNGLMVIDTDLLLVQINTGQPRSVYNLFVPMTESIPGIRTQETCSNTIGSMLYTLNKIRRSIRNLLRNFSNR